MIPAKQTDDSVRRRTSRRGGFSLVELLAVILIIGILSSIFLMALAKSTETAKVARTRSLIQKMHNMVMARWDAYRTLRLPIAAEAKAGSVNPQEFNSSNERERFRQNVARRRMFALRELVRLEMPDRFSDLTFEPVVLLLPGTTTPARPSLWNSYMRKLAVSKSANPVTRGMSFQEFITHVSKQYQSAECLYLILTTGIDDSSVAAEHFAPSDVGDKDKDGLAEFHDAWGNPIEFLRWAPGFESPAQPLYRYPESDPRAKYFHSSQPRDSDDPSLLVSHWDLKIDMVADPRNAAQTVPKLVIIDQDDPFNPMRVGPVVDSAAAGAWQRSSRWRPGDPAPEHGFILVPLIYSNGPDFQSGIHHGAAPNAAIQSAPSQGGSNAGIYQSDPYAVWDEGFGPFYRGSSNETGYDYDNVSNHHVIKR